MTAKPMIALAALVLAACATVPAGGPTVKITPFGSHAGELCNRDRAMIFEDPDRRAHPLRPRPVGARGRRPAARRRPRGAGEPRARRPHGRPAPHRARSRDLPAADARDRRAQHDDRRDRRVEERGAGDDQPDGELPRQARRGDQGPADGRVPGRRVRRRPHGAVRGGCLAGNNLGGTRTFKTAGAAKGVEVTIVPASHDSSVTRGLLSEAERKNLEPDNLTLPLGPPSGYVIRFTNGLVVYLTGDTAVHADHEDRRCRLPQAERDGAEPGPERDHDGVGRLHRERHRQAGDRRHHAPERGRDAGRQGACRLAHRRAVRDCCAAPSCSPCPAARSSSTGQGGASPAALTML